MYSYLVTTKQLHKNRQEVLIMKNTAKELRDATGRLVYVYYPEKNVLEHFEKGCCSRIILPPGTKFKFDPGKKPAIK